MMKRISKNTREYRKRLEDLLNQEPVLISYIRANKTEFDFPAVYLIKSPKGEIIYAGKTKTRSLYRRVDQHISEDHDCDLNRMLKTKDRKKLGRYQLLYERTDNSRERGFFEYFVISVVKPKYNRVER